MARWAWISISVIAGLALAGAAAIRIGALTWQRATERAVAELLPSAAAPVRPAGAWALDGLPAPVARYFAFALPDGPPPVRAARIRWSGDFRMRPEGGWAPFTAVQDFTATVPGFVWDAEIRMMPLVPVRVRDGYREGRGAMRGRVGGVVPVVDEGGTPEIAQSALARWLGEAVWFPTALLPREGLHWEAVDDATSRVTVRDGVVSASAEFHFGPGGEITRMTAMRYRDVGGETVLTPFEGDYRDYALRNGVRVPTSAEVAWLLPEGRFVYWRARPVEIRYDGSADRP